MFAFAKSQMHGRIENLILKPAVFLTLALLCAPVSIAQKKSARKPNSKPARISEVDKLRNEYIETTKQYKASLEKLLLLYQASERKATEQFAKSQELFKAGLISKVQLDESEQAVTVAQAKVAEVKQQALTADTQIAQALVEVEGEKQLAKLGNRSRGALVRTTAMIRYNGTGSWLLSQAGKIEMFFQQTFKRPLPIAVFGQGAIHNQWHLDHHNAMDISLNPDGPEGQALINFLRTNGIPFSAFRMAIPGVATGPHIHIGMPSHRY